MRLGFFGGTFDPPHNGHLAVALAAADRFRLDRVLLAPVGSQPLKPEGTSASFTDRLAMARLLCAADARLEASSDDAPRSDGQPNFTIDTLTRLRSNLEPADELFVVTGVDAFADLRRWRAPEALLNVADWIVVSRPGLNLQAVLPSVVSPAQAHHVHPLDSVHEEVSATLLRARLQANEPCEEMLPPGVLEYIRIHDLYGSSRT